MNKNSQDIENHTCNFKKVNISIAVQVHVWRTTKMKIIPVQVSNHSFYNKKENPLYMITPAVSQSTPTYPLKCWEAPYIPLPFEIKQTFPYKSKYKKFWRPFVREKHEWRRAYARNVRLYYPFRRKTKMRENFKCNKNGAIICNIFCDKKVCRKLPEILHRNNGV